MQIQKEFDRIFKDFFSAAEKVRWNWRIRKIMLETGVIITAQPPGKKLQNMMQLSGG